MKTLGGGAVDAIIATAFCQGVVQSHSSNVGGATHMTIYSA